MNAIARLFDPYRGLSREIYIIFISRIINSIGSFVQPLLALILTQKIGLDAGTAGQYITFISVITVPSMIIGGKLVDTIGRKKIIMLSQGSGALTVIMCGFMEPTIEMTYMLMASSVLFSFCSPAYDSMIADITTPENRKAAYSLTYMGWNIGFAIGPILGGLLYQNHLPLIFIIGGISSILTVILIALFIRETKPNVEQAHIDDSRILEKGVEGSVFKVLWARPILLLFALIFFCYQFEYSQWGFTLPLQMGDIFQEKGAAYYGKLAAFNGLIVILFTPLITKMTNSIKPLRVISLGGLGYAISFGMLAFTNNLPLFFVSMTIMTIGEIMISINASTFIANQTPASHRGRVSSILPILYGAGYAFGPLIMGRYIDQYSISSAWLVIGALGLFSSLMMRLLERKAVTSSEPIIVEEIKLEM